MEFRATTKKMKKTKESKTSEKVALEAQDVDEALAPQEASDTPTDAQPSERNQIKKKDIYDAVTIATGLRKREVREAVDATLAYLHQQLLQGKQVQVPPLGKIKVIEKEESDTIKRRYRLILRDPSISGLDEKDASDPEEALEADAD